MKLHTDLTGPEVIAALTEAKRQGVIAGHIELMEFKQEGSRSHQRSFRLRLGTRTRDAAHHRYANTGQWGASRGPVPVYAATFDEWGWFYAEILRRDPSAWCGQYRGVVAFKQATDGKYGPEQTFSRPVAPDPETDGGGHWFSYFNGLTEPSRIWVPDKVGSR